MIRSWENAWEQFTPFLAFPPELRRIVYTTNAIESLNARFRRAVRHRGHFPNDQAALKVLYLVATARRPNRENLTGKINGWKKILNTLTMHYGDRITATTNQ
jgi:putative transposase